MVDLLMRTVDTGRSHKGDGRRRGARSPVADDPGVVAAAIVKASMTDGPLHVLVGDDAESEFSSASRMTFEEFAAMTKAEHGR